MTHTNLCEGSIAFNFSGSEADEDFGKGRLLFPLWKLLSLFSGWLVKTIVCCGVSIIKEEEIACEWVQLLGRAWLLLEGEIYQRLPDSGLLQEALSLTLCRSRLLCWDHPALLLKEAHKRPHTTDKNEWSCIPACVTWFMQAKMWISIVIWKYKNHYTKKMGTRRALSAGRNLCVLL